MEIKPFKMRVTPEQSRIVQQTLFNNGYKKCYGDEIYIPKEPKTFIYLNKDGNFTANNSDKNYFTYNILPELTFQEFFNRYVKWCIRGSKELAKWERDKMKSTCDAFLNCTDYYYAPKSDSLVFWNASSKLLENYIELTFEQFEKYVLKSKESKDMEKKIIGYKLKEDFKQYEEAAIIIATMSKESFYSLIPKVGYNFGNGSKLYFRFKKAGVLDLWFEPVYAENSKELYFGKVKFTIKKGYADTEYGKVTKEEISKVFDYFNNTPALISGKYQLKFDLHNDYEIKFGCQSGRFGELRIIYEAFE